MPVKHAGKGRGFPAITISPKREPFGHDMPAAGATGSSASSGACSSARGSRLGERSSNSAGQNSQVVQPIQGRPAGGILEGEALQQRTALMRVDVEPEHPAFSPLAGTASRDPRIQVHQLGCAVAPFGGVTASIAVAPFTLQPWWCYLLDDPYPFGSYELLTPLLSHGGAVGCVLEPGRLATSRDLPHEKCQLYGRFSNE